jgi:hypothetical protein
MALHRMRWSNTGASLIGGSTRDGAELRSIDEPQREHVHVYLHAAKVADQAAPAGGLPVRAPTGHRLAKTPLGGGGNRHRVRQ